MFTSSITRSAHAAGLRPGRTETHRNGEKSRPPTGTRSEVRRARQRVAVLVGQARVVQDVSGLGQRRRLPGLGPDPGPAVGKRSQTADLEGRGSRDTVRRARAVLDEHRGRRARGQRSRDGQVAVRSERPQAQTVGGRQ